MHGDIVSKYTLQPLYVTGKYLRNSILLLKIILFSTIFGLKLCYPEKE